MIRKFTFNIPLSYQLVQVIAILCDIKNIVFFKRAHTNIFLKVSLFFNIKSHKTPKIFRHKLSCTNKLFLLKTKEKDAV